MTNLFDQPHDEYRFDRKVLKLRKKIANRTAELGIHPDHTEDGHFYVYGGNKYPSVTMKLQVVKDPGLMNWKMNRALEYVVDNLGPLAHAMLKQSIPEVEKLIEEARLAPQLEFKGAGDIGTAVHSTREAYFDDWINDPLFEHGPIVDFAFPDDLKKPGVIPSLKAIENCITTLKAQPLACELRLADDKLKLGGTLDDLWAVPVDGKMQTWLVDLKTSNIGNKNSYMMQVATYWAMFKKLYKMKIDRVFILHTSKKVFGEYDLIEVKHPKRYFEMAKTAYKLSDELEELDEIKKPLINKI